MSRVVRNIKMRNGRKAKPARVCSMEQRARRLNGLKDLHQNAQRRQNKDHNRQAHNKIYRSFDDAVYRVFEGSDFSN